MWCEGLHFSEKAVSLHRVFHSIRFKVNKVGIQWYPIFFVPMSRCPRCVRLERHMCHPVKLFAPKGFLLCRCWWGAWLVSFFSFLLIFSSHFPDARRVAPIRGSVWCLSTVLLAIICKCTNTADAAALLFATLRRQPISILAYCHISTLPCSHHFALSLSASWSSYCFCRRTSSFIKRAVIFSVPGWP